MNFIIIITNVLDYYIETSRQCLCTSFLNTVLYDLMALDYKIFNQSQKEYMLITQSEIA